eukprot:257021-Chlamydomonas_euryale.AAC.2
MPSLQQEHEVAVEALRADAAAAAAALKRTIADLEAQLKRSDEVGRGDQRRYGDRGRYGDGRRKGATKKEGGAGQARRREFLSRDGTSGRK